MAASKRGVGRHNAASNPLERSWRAWLKLDAMTDEQLESEAADKIRDASDKHWFAMTEEQKKLFHKRVKEHVEKKKTGSAANAPTEIR